MLFRSFRHTDEPGCSLKVYKSSVIKQVRLYGEMHRFIPAWVAAVVPPSRIGEIVVNHNARIAGESKYGISRTFRVILDLLSVYFYALPRSSGTLLWLDWISARFSQLALTCVLRFR